MVTFSVYDAAVLINKAECIIGVNMFVFWTETKCLPYHVTRCLKLVKIVDITKRGWIEKNIIIHIEKFQ
jgi:hypothetical protein